LGVGPFFIKRRLVLSGLSLQTVSRQLSPTISIGVWPTLAAYRSSSFLAARRYPPVSIRIFLAAGRTGLQHVSAWVTCSEFDSLRATLIDDGLSPRRRRGTIAASGNAALRTYATADRADEIIYEVSDLLAIKHIARVQLIEEGRPDDGMEPTPVRESKNLDQARLPPFATNVGPGRCCRAGRVTFFRSLTGTYGQFNRGCRRTGHSPQSPCQGNRSSGARAARHSCVS